MSNLPTKKQSVPQSGEEWVKQSFNNDMSPTISLRIEPKLREILNDADLDKNIGFQTYRVILEKLSALIELELVKHYSPRLTEELEGLAEALKQATQARTRSSKYTESESLVENQIDVCLANRLAKVRGER